MCSTGKLYMGLLLSQVTDQRSSRHLTNINHSVTCAQLQESALLVAAALHDLIMQKPRLICIWRCNILQC